MECWSAATCQFDHNLILAQRRINNLPTLSGSEATLLPHPPPKNGAGLFQGTPLKPFSTPFDGRGFTTAESRL
jgi:hypothetical protein